MKVEDEMITAEEDGNDEVLLMQKLCVSRRRVNFYLSHIGRNFSHEAPCR